MIWELAEVSENDIHILRNPTLAPQPDRGDADLLLADESPAGGAEAALEQYVAQGGAAGLAAVDADDGSLVVLQVYDAGLEPQLARPRDQVQLPVLNPRVAGRHDVHPHGERPQLTRMLLAIKLRERMVGLSDLISRFFGALLESR